MGDKAFLADVVKKGGYLAAKLNAMDGIESVRGMGLMLGAKPKQGTAKEIAAACAADGLLVLTAKEMLRFLPPLTISAAELDKGLSILEKVLRKFE